MGAPAVRQRRKRENRPPGFGLQISFRFFSFFPPPGSPRFFLSLSITFNALDLFPGGSPMMVFVSFLGDFKLCLGFCRVVVLNVVFAKGKSLRFYFN